MSVINNLADTWNNGSSVFTAIGMDVTDTASDGSSYLWNMKVGGVTQGYLQKDGTLYAGEILVGPGTINWAVHLDSSKVGLRVDATFSWFSDFNLASGGTWDTNLTRDAAGVVRADGASSGTGRFLAQGFTFSSSHVNVQTGTTYTVVAADNGKTITLNNASAITVTIPSGLGAGFSCDLIQLGAGQVSVAPGSGTTLVSLGSLRKISGQYGAGSVLALAADTFHLNGNLSA